MVAAAFVVVATNGDDNHIAFFIGSEVHQSK